jgi:uroporphyrinogen III methyltransferase/synthase
MNTQPLHNKRIVVTRPEAQAGALLARLRELGAQPIVCPAIAIVPPADYAPLDRAITGLDQYDWLIVTSANGVRVLLGRMAELGADVAALRRLRIGAIGPATAQALAEHGLAAGFVPTVYVAEAILEQIGDVAGRRILLPRADIAREALAAGLRAQGADVDEIAAYRTVPGAGTAELAAGLRAGTVDAVTFTSSSTVRYLLDGLEAAGQGRSAALALLQSAAIVCIGPITAATAYEEGLRVDVVAREYTGDGLVMALLEWFGEHHVPADSAL